MTNAAVQQLARTHGEQGTLLAAARPVEIAPDIDSKYFASIQVIDEELGIKGR